MILGIGEDWLKFEMLLRLMYKRINVKAQEITCVKDVKVVGSSFTVSAPKYSNVFIKSTHPMSCSGS